jgi:hypothetical protein
MNPLSGGSVCQIGNEKAASEEKENPERFHLRVPVSKHGGGRIARANRGHQNKDKLCQNKVELGFKQAALPIGAVVGPQN